MNCSPAIYIKLIMFNVLYFQDQGYCQNGPVTLEMIAYLTHDYSIRKYSTTYQLNY